MDDTKNKKQQGCEWCEDNQVDCRNCAEAGNWIVCSELFPSATQCQFYKPQNYCGYCGRKLVE